MSADFANSLPPTFPVVKTHARQRWDERTPAEVSIETAWYLGIDLTDRLPYFDDGRSEFVRIRYYADYDALLIRRNTVLTTVLSVADARDERYGEVIRDLAAAVSRRDDTAGDGS